MIDLGLFAETTIEHIKNGLKSVLQENA